MTREERAGNNHPRIAKQQNPWPMTLLQHRKRRENPRQSLRESESIPASSYYQLFRRSTGEIPMPVFLLVIWRAEQSASDLFAFRRDAVGAFSLILALQALSACTEPDFSLHTG